MPASPRSAPCSSCCSVAGSAVPWRRAERLGTTAPLLAGDQQLDGDRIDIVRHAVRAAGLSPHAKLEFLAAERAGPDATVVGASCVAGPDAGALLILGMRISDAAAFDPRA